MPAPIPPKQSRNCIYFAKGKCNNGERCKFSHAIPIQPPNTSSSNPAPPSSKKLKKPASQTTTLSSPNPTRFSEPKNDASSSAVAPQTPASTQALPTPAPPRNRIKKSQIACFNWEKGACPKGDKCFYGHDPQVQRAFLLQQQEAFQREQERIVILQHAAWMEQVRQEAFRKEQERLAFEEFQLRERLRQEKERLRQEKERLRQEEERRAWEAEQARRREAEARRRREEQQRREEEERRRQEAQRRREEAQRRREELQRQREEEERRREEEERVRFEERSREEARFVLQQVVQGSIVTLATGLEVRGVLTGFESCRITVQNLPEDARQDEVEALFAQQGLDMGRFHLAGVKPMPNRKREAEVITDSESGAAIAAGLSDVEFRNERLNFTVGVYNGAGGMGASAARDTDLLVVTFHAPSSRYVVALSPEAIDDKIRELNGSICAGRRVKVERNTQPPGRILHYFNPNSIKIMGLPVNVNDSTVAEFAGASSAQRLKMGPYSDLDTALQSLRIHIDTHSRNQTTSFDVISRGEDVKGTVSVQVRLASHEVAKEVQESLQDKRLSFIGNSFIWLRLNDPFLYTINISHDQYRAQRSQWDELRESIKDRKACNLRIHEANVCVRIQVVGNVKMATGALKVRVEHLAGGEKVEGWHQKLAYPSAEFLERIKDVGAYFKSTPRTQTLTLYGKSREIAAAREIVVAELERLASLDYTAHLSRFSVGYFVRQGLAALTDMYGEENVQLDATKGTITLRGPEEARHQLSRLIDESKVARPPTRRKAETDATCPICMDTASSPYKLGCGHIYCTACLRHLLTSAADTKTFPIKCDGDESRCGTRIGIPIIQQFLPRPDFEKLVGAVFDWHISQNPHEFKSCKTPSCTQIFRTSPVTTVLQCPSCFAEVCARCGEDGHKDMTCDQFKLAHDPAEQERLSEQWLSEQSAIKKCPSCSRLMEKIDGCNHMTCRCGAHICWVCMGVYPADQIYNHLNSAHGGFYGEPAL